MERPVLISIVSTNSIHSRNAASVAEYSISPHESKLLPTAVVNCLRGENATRGTIGEYFLQKYGDGIRIRVWRVAKLGRTNKKLLLDSLAYVIKIDRYRASSTPTCVYPCNENDSIKQTTH